MFASAAINKYIYVTAHESEYDDRIRLRYSRMEEVKNINHIENEIFRETLRFAGKTKGIEVSSHAEIPSGTGLGSSGSFGVGVLNALTKEKPEYLAFHATRIQMDLGFPVGWQDTVIAAVGGLQVFEISKDGVVRSHPLNVNKDELLKRLRLYYTGIKRDANEVLHQSTTEGLELVQELAWKSKAALEQKDWKAYGEHLNEHWKAKKLRGGMTNERIDELYELGMKRGALGGKLIGAGSGGFLMFLTNDPARLDKAMPIKRQEFSWDMEGSTIIYEL